MEIIAAAAMRQLLELNTDSGGSILLEVDERPDGPVTRGGGRAEDAIVKAEASLEQVVGRLAPALRGMVGQLRDAADWPDAVEIEFAVKVSSDANVIIARAGGEANFKIAVRWTRGGG
jgi:hypothetical protein